LVKSNSKVRNFTNEEVISLNKSFQNNSLVLELAVYEDGENLSKEWMEKELQ